MKARSLLVITMVACVALGASASTRQEDIKELYKSASYAPRPVLPLKAYDMHWSGVGVYRLHIRPDNGEVTEIKILKRTGHFVLDSAAMQALIQWVFRKGTEEYIDVRITFGPY